MPQTAKPVQFRALPLRESPARVDRENHVIYGASVAQAVEALGHGFLLDNKTIEQIVTLGNAAKNGIKSRYTHPGLSSDGMGKHLGRLKNFRQEGDKAIADLHLADAAFKSPEGNLGEYVMDLAEEDAAAFGMSVVIDVDTVWTLDDGTETSAEETVDPDDFYGEPVRPKNALTDLPVVRVQTLRAGDVVDEPAANRDGMFSQHLWGTNLLAEEAFGHIDELLGRMGMKPAKALDIALKYCDARGVSAKGMKMAEKQVDKEKTVEAPVVNTEELAKLQADMKALQDRLAAEEEAKQEALHRNEKLTEALDNTNKRVADMELAARTTRFRALAAGWAGDPAQHVALLEALGEGSDLFNAYATQQNAVAEQLQKGGLFAELGHGKDMATGSAADKLDSKARELMAADPKLTKAQAVALAAERYPELYSEHVAEMRGN